MSDGRCGSPTVPVCRDCVDEADLVAGPCRHAEEPWLVWLPMQSLWWRPKAEGYTNNIFLAGTYSAAKAISICNGIGLERGDYPVPLSTALKQLMKDNAKAKAGTVGSHLGVFPKVADYLGGL